MMISPESYYEQFLKGKTTGEILKKIRGLKNEISRLKLVMEQANKSQITIDSSEEIQLSCTREYLKRAIEVLKEAGCMYKPSIEELEYASYVENIPYACKIKFTSGGYFGGYKTKILNITDNKVFVKTIDTYAEEDLTNLGKESLITKQELIESIIELYIFEWRSYYSSNILDGCQWDIEIEFSNGYKSFKSGGSNAYPYNFDELCKLLNKVEEDKKDV